LSRLRNLELVEGGRYLVVVGTHDGRGRGSYRLLAHCADELCFPHPLPFCHPVLADRIRTCIDDQLADPESGLSPGDALQACGSEGDILGPARDQVCEAGPAPFCSLSFELFFNDQAYLCQDELFHEVRARTCTFGSTFPDLRRSGHIHILEDRLTTSAAGLSALEQAQVVAAVNSSGAGAEATTADEAYAIADAGQIRLLRLWDASHRRAFAAVELGRGDTSVGQLFAGGSVEVVATINDSSLDDCGVLPGPEGRDCRVDGDCAVGRCFGQGETGELGKCVNLAADPDDGQPCSAHLDCAAGLLCAGLSREADGLCLPAWMRSRFEERPHLELADAATTTTELEVYGLATVDMDVFLEAEIEHAQPRDLRVTLTNPAGNEVLVLEGAAGEGGALEIDDPIVGFSGDEQVNGRWTLTVTDRTSGAAGRLDRWALRIGSRFD
jgi:hypothetical protein